MSETWLSRSFFARDPVTCARELIGCELVWEGCSGILVETEAYAALDDEASHTFSRPSARSFVAEQTAGAAYVYLNYGMHWMLNVLVKGGAADGFVLLRALEPRAGAEAMRARRRQQAETALCSGPGKLGQALGVTGADHGRDFCAGSSIGFRLPLSARVVTADVRVGITRSAGLPWRFLAAGSQCVSVRAGKVRPV